MNSRFIQAVQRQRQKTEQHNPILYGVLGITQNGQTVVEVPDRPSYVYVQLRSSQYEVIQAFNSVVSPVYGLPVALQWQGNRYVITERDTLRYSNWIDSSAYLPRHASTHEFEGSAGDVVFVSQQQFLPLMPMPSGSSGNRQMVIGHYNLMTATGTFQYFATQTTRDLTVWNPTSPTGAVMVLVALDATNGNLVYSVGSGTAFGNWLTGTSDVLPHIPAVSDISRYMPIAGVRLVNGTSIITWDNIYDVRPLFGATRSVSVGGGGGGGGSSSGVAFLDNGILVAYANQVALVGAGYSIFNTSGSEVQLQIGGGGGTSGSLALDTSNGPLFGPLVVYQKFPNVLNQYFDYSTIVGFLSGTNTSNFAAAGEFVNWSTGSRSYGIYVDDEAGGAESVYIWSNGAMDKSALGVEAQIDFNFTRDRYFSPHAYFTRYGGGVNNNAWYVAPMLQMNERQPNNVAAADLEIDANFTPVTQLYPMHTGRPMSLSYPFLQGDGPYMFDTYYDMYGAITGTVHSYWNNQGTIIGWLTPAGDFAMRQLRIREYAPPFGTPPVSGSFSQGAKNLVNGTFTVPTTAVTMSSRIYLTTQFGSGTHVGYTYVYSRAAGSGFTVRSSDLLDTSLVAWLIVEPT